MATSHSTPAPASAQVPDPIRYLDDLPPESVVVRCEHVGEPAVKERPRFNTKTARVYTPGTTKQHQRALAGVAVATGLLPPEADAEWAYGIRSIFRVQTHQRKDVDNMLKVVLDAMNRLVFADDSQVKELMGWSVLDCERPRTEFVVYRLYKIDRETGYCTQCGKSFRRYKSWRHRLYCSRACFGIKERNAVQVPCARCGKSLLRTRSQVARCKAGEFFCSGACIGLHKRRSVACSHCGNAISRPQSFTKPGQMVFYCNRACRAAAQIGTKRSATPEELSAASRKGWQTRRNSS